MQHIRTILLVVVFIFAFSGLKAANPPPVNDTVCDAIDIGMLPIPGACPWDPKGDTVHVNGSTDWANYNTFDFAPNYGFGQVSPDVWYRFRGTGSFIYIEMNGFNDLDSFFVRLHLSQGSCLSLVPLYCATTTNGFMQATFLTPDVGAEYYLQIGGSRYDETGGFAFWIKSFNECTECVKNASVSLSPSPWFGRYGTSDTVQMCVTVDRWELTTSSNLHSIVPVFGDEWDTTTLTPTVFPGATGQWIWAQNIPSPAGSVDGFYFDANFDGDPTNNPGDAGNVNTSWTACWSISTKPFCNTYDANVDINIYSDDVTGNGNSFNLCQEYWPIHLSLAGWCCPDPIINITPMAGCAAATSILIDPVSVNSSDSFDIVLYDDSMHVYTFQQNVTNTAVFTVTVPGDYLLEVYNVSTGCISFHTVNIPAAFAINFTQTSVGCTAGSGSVIASVIGGTQPFTYSWTGITTFNDSLAFNLDEGYVAVAITDGAGCTVTDSVYVDQLAMPGAQFDYADVSYCSNDDTIQVYYDPYTAGGQFILQNPTGAGITVDQNNGTIFLNNTTLAPPFWVYVKYTVGTACVAAYVDSVQIVQQPAQPISSAATNLDWCIGANVPVLNINIGAGLPFWYDPQTTQTAFGYSYTPPLDQSTVPGTYLYGVQYFSDFTFGCGSVPTIFVLTAHGLPVFSPTAAVTICPGDTATLMVTGVGPLAYSWNPDPTIGVNYGDTVYTSPQSTTIYTVSASDGTCIGTAFSTVIVDDPANCTGLHISNGITPNGDGHNDSWIIDGAELADNMTVTIYNRWGLMVWKGNNYNNTTVVWRGEDESNKALPSGTYFYIITQDNHDSSTGWIELNR